MLASLVERFLPGRKKALTYRDLPAAADHKALTLESIAQEGEICRRLHSDLLRHFPRERASIETLIAGYREFARTAITPADAYHAFRYLYWKTAGASNALIGKYISSQFPKPCVPKSISSIFGEFTSADIQKAVAGLKQDGVYCPEQKLPLQSVRELVESMDEAAAKSRGSDFCQPTADRTTFLEAELLNTPMMTRIASDPLLYFVASEYLNVQPLLGYLTAWISRPHANMAETLSQRAQLFHFDMSNPRFIKAFIYLNDVSERNGPHCLVPGTHRQKAKSLWKEGRIDDDEMAAYYPRKTWQVQTGAAGSIFFVDTSGFHKGIPVVEGHRRLAQFYYIDTLFGEHVPLEDNVPAFDPWRQGSNIQDYAARFFSRYALSPEL